MGRRATCAAAFVTLVALIGASASTAFGATPVDEVVAPVPLDSPTGSYIVVLEGSPAAGYGGGAAGLAPTMPEPGEKLDPHSSHVREYAAYLEKRQGEVAAAAEVEPATTYQITLNGFSAKMSAEQAARVAAMDGILAVYPDEIFHPEAASQADSLGLEEAGGAWESVGGSDAAGAGVVVGVIDTGIAPENPSFAGERLRKVRSAEPYLVGDEVVFAKAEGGQFRSTRASGDGWSDADYSTKLIGAQYFATGAIDAGIALDHDVLSPLDSDGHGSQTTSIAVGNADVAATVDGVEFGSLSGVAPAAKIAAYKACFAGPDPLVTTDDACVGSDVLAAIERAVADGVDVIDYSIGGGAAAAGWAPDDIALYHAAIAGVFVAVSAGNAGPGASTVGERGAPWYTTVAASTVATFEATVQLSTGFAAPGVSMSLPQGPVTAPVVYAGDAGLAGTAEAGLCYLGTLDPAVVTGRIVICDRGTNAKAEKSQEVADAGGVGMILANVTADTTDAEVHAVPTVHIDATDRAALLAELAGNPNATATLVGGNLTGVDDASPQIAEFSSRGPAIGAGGDILTPDVAAPGVSILGATQDTSTGEPTWGIASGTSLAASHVAGLAALYLGAHPAATPDEVKSAIMTTAYDTVHPDGSADVDPFAQGAGHIDGGAFLDPGLLYLNGPEEWAGYLQAHGRAASDGPPLDGADVNLASVVVADLGLERRVTRSLTATGGGTYRAAASIPGVDVEVSPETLTFAGPGDSQEFEVVFANRTAPVEVWASGFLTWTAEEDGTSVRAPLAVRPSTVDATALVTGDGIAGSAEVSIVSGVTDEVALHIAGLAPVELLVDRANPVAGHSGDEDSGDANGDVAWTVDIPAGSPLARFTLEASDDSDLDFSVYRLVSASDSRYSQRWTSASGPGPDQITLRNPRAGSYLVVAHLSDAHGPLTWDATAAVVPGSATGSLTSAQTSLAGVTGQDVRYTLSWAGLEPDRRYLGVVGYGDSDVLTVVQIDAGAVPAAAATPPTIAGDPEVGETLVARPGDWEGEGVEFSFEWLRDGEPIPGAVARDYRVRTADVGAALSVRVTASRPGEVNPGTADSEELIVNAGSRVAVTMNRYSGTVADEFAVTVDVETMRGDPAAGSVKVSVDAAQYTGTLADGTVTFALPAQTPGVHIVVVKYSGSDRVDGSTSVSGFVVRR
ncbi:S8 family serine peptidase [Microbacterium sp.]|uniref:S8 family serine peptidase n=1 Tax=Microbacterium sp. TaxID=51671 RepID=UPI002E319B5B|nr:S8 family serine peptidase [Microbacterium sp.]HEX5728352.1 S8 family serine peptidase [Microbacterium sp.]